MSLYIKLTTAIAKTKLLWPRLREALIYEYKHAYLEGSCRLPTMAYDFPSHRHQKGFTVPGMNSFLFNRSQIESKTLIIPHKSHATIADLGTSCLASRYNSRMPRF